MKRRLLMLSTALSALAAGAGFPRPARARDVLPIPELERGRDVSPDARQSPRVAPQAPLRPPSGAPNVLIVLVDDMGFGASSSFGGPCNMPTAERLAAGGLRFSRFHNTALCSPSRQSLLTGRNHHAVNMAAIAEVATAHPGGTGVRPPSAATIAEVLKLNGYSTGAFGKMHQTPPWETSPSGPFDRWPTGDGFEKFYGFLGGDCSQWFPPIYDGTTIVDPPRIEGQEYHLSQDLADQTLGWIRSIHALTPDKPFFAYLSFGATHAPHHAPREYIEKYRGRFDRGWDVQRQETFERQKRLGVIPTDAELTPRPDLIAAWDSMTADDKRVAARLMEVYAGFAEHTDAQVGRLIAGLEELGVLEDTLVFYLLGDNGASAEATRYGTFNEMSLQNGIPQTTAEILPHLDKLGGPEAFNHYPAGWAHAMNTPYQWAKTVASHYGGTRCGVIVHWPKGFQAKGEIRNQWHHFIDVVPTILEVAKLPAPAIVNGVQQQRMDGVSLAYTFSDAGAEGRRKTQYFEVAGNRAIYHEGWSAVTRHAPPWSATAPLPRFTDDVWELYGPDDWTQSRNLAQANPQKLAELQQRFVIEAARNNVFPLDDRQYERLVAEIAGRPDLLAGRTRMRFYPGMRRLNENVVPNVKNKSFRVIAQIEVPADGAKGAIVAQGGRFAGWSLYLRDGVPTYCHNWMASDLYYVRGDAPLPAGRHTIRFEFAYDGGGNGKGGMGTLFVGDRQVGQGRIEKTVPNIFSYDDLLDIGMDSLEQVTPEYGVPEGRFTGRIAWVDIDNA
ncbi:arylsulfatase [Roseomonas sp. HJA6]|uniref:Arylsulfatase n=1 Tax=Roseomonas alba TaxID=2846776 RepID=A0ABS7AAH0_9PROT|nr:arylsulfatase [Neoroseomonas alba]MBW6399301.1 arylsulfatase [Neoroseomonas alba]